MRVECHGPRGRLSGEAEDRRPSSTTCAMDPAVDRRPRHRQRRPRLPGQHGHLHVQSRDAARGARRRRTITTSATKCSRPPCGRGTCRCTCSTAIGKTSARSARSTTRTCSSRSRIRRSIWPSATAPIYTRPRFLPPTRIDGVVDPASLVADGCVIGPGARIENSVIGLRCRIGRDVTIRNSVIMGADFYETPDATCGRPQP